MQAFLCMEIVNLSKTYYYTNFHLPKVYPVGPQNQSAAVGGTAEFTCWVRGSPTPQTSIVSLAASQDMLGLDTTGDTAILRSNGPISQINVTNIIRWVFRNNDISTHLHFYF